MVASRSEVVNKRSIQPWVLPETVILALICLGDMIQTLFVVRSGVAIEANPVLAQTLSYSPWVFALVKCASFMIPLTAVEVLRPLCPMFVRAALRIGASGYLTVYVIGVFHINHLIPALNR